MKIRYQLRYMVPDSGSLSFVECFGPKLCWAVGSQQLLRSEDGGRTWTNSYFSSPLQVGINPAAVGFLSELEGLLLAEKGPMEVIYYRTEDSGKTWSQVRRLTDGGYVWAKMSAPRGTGRVWTLIKQRDGRAFIELMNGKRGWSRVQASLPGEPCQILFIDKSKGWILERWNKNSWIDGSPHVSSTTTLLHESVDGGRSWRVVSRKKCSGRKLLAVGQKTLLMIGDDGIYSSQNYGNTWQRVFKPRLGLYDVHFQGTVGIAIGTEGLIGKKSDVLLLLSENAGKSWTEMEAPVADAFCGVRMTTWSSGILASEKALYTFQIS